MAASMASVIEALTQTAAAQQRIQLDKDQKSKNNQNSGRNSASPTSAETKESNQNSINSLTNALSGVTSPQPGNGRPGFPMRNESPVASQASALLNSLASSVGQPITMPSPPTTNLMMGGLGVGLSGLSGSLGGNLNLPTSMPNTMSSMTSNLNSLLQSSQLGGNNNNQQPMSQSSLQTTLQNLTNQITNSPPANTISNNGVNNNNNQIPANLTPADFKRPPHTYPSLIAQAILDSPNNLITLRGIYDYIMEKYPYYKYCHDKSAWQNSIRHNLSLNQCFIKVPRYENAAKSNYWTMTNEGFDEFAGDNAFKRRRRRGKYDCQVLYKQSIKSKLNQDNQHQQKGQISSQNDGQLNYENSPNSPSPTNPLKRSANSAQDALSGILSPLMKMPALGTGGAPNGSAGNGNDNSAQFLANLTLSNLLGTQNSSNTPNLNLSGSATPDNQHGNSGNSNNNVLNLLSNPLYQQLLLGGSGNNNANNNSPSPSQMQNNNNSSLTSLQAQLLQSLTSKTNTSTNNTINLQNHQTQHNNSHQNLLQNHILSQNNQNSNQNSLQNSLQNQLAHQNTQNSHNQANQEIQAPLNFASNQLQRAAANKIANTSSSSVSQENQVSPNGSSGANSNQTPENQNSLVNASQLSSKVSSRVCSNSSRNSNSGTRLAKDLKVHISLDSQIITSPQVPASSESYPIALQGVKDICLYFMNLTQSELSNIFKVNFGAVDENSSKEVLVSSILDQIFTSKVETTLKTEKTELVESSKINVPVEDPEIKKVAEFLESKNLARFAGKFVGEGFTLATFLEMGENDVADVSEVVGLKGGEKMRLKQLIRQNVKNESVQGEVKQDVIEKVSGDEGSGNESK